MKRWNCFFMFVVTQRMFAIACSTRVKSGFHNRVIYTYNHPSEHNNLLSLLNQAEDVTVVDCSSTVFKQCRKYLDKGYTGIKDGQVLANHVFHTTHTNGETKLIIKKDEMELAEHNSVQDLKKRGSEVAVDLITNCGWSTRDSPCQPCLSHNSQQW